MPENKSASFEASLARLQEIVTELEGDQVDLERSVQLYGEGRRLVEHCENLLGVAEKALREAGNGTGNEAAPPPPASSSGEQFEDEISF
jgi:exodeoxyribonuclease VII small subunit